MVDQATIARFTLDMALETESASLDPIKVDKGVGFVLSGAGLSPRYWVALDDKGEVSGMVGVSPEWSDWWG
jgi:hypothetical protein